MLLRAICLALALSTAGHADIVRASSYAEAKDAASTRGVPLLVFVHGSDWNLRGQRLREHVWNAEALERVVEDIVFVDVDVLQTPTDEERAANDARNEGWSGAGVVTYPAFIAYGVDGAVIGSRQGSTLPRDLDGATDALVELANAAGEHVKWSRILAEARDAGDREREIAAWITLIDLPLDRPAGAAERLSELMPDDTSGLIARLALPPWHVLIAEATREAVDGNAEQARDRLAAMLDSGLHDDTQRAWLYVALGSVYRQWEGHEADAATAFKAAWALDAGRPSTAGRRWYLRFHADPSLEFGWLPHHCATTNQVWIVEDVPRLESGSVAVTFSYTKGRHALLIDSIEILNGDLVVVTATAPGRAGSTHDGNVYTLDLPMSVAEPRLRVTARSDGGTDSHGTIRVD